MTTGNTELNPDKLAQSCGITDSRLSSDAVIKNIEKLEHQYPEAELITIYNYFLMTSENPDVIMYLIRCLDKYRHPSSLEYLVDVLLLKNAGSSEPEAREKFNNTRVMCAKAIANQKNTSAVSSLLYCLNNKDENYRVRLACADALGRIGDRFAVAPLIEVVKDEGEKSVYLRESAVSALGLLGDTRAIDPLVSILETKQGIMDKFSFLKERVIEALNKMSFNNDERVFRALKNSLSDESTQVRINAIEAIMDSGSENAEEVIRNCLENDEDDEVKKNAMIALYNLTGRSILDEIAGSNKYSEALKAEAAAIIEEYENNDGNGEDKV